MLMALRVTDRLRVSRVAHAISAGYFSLAGGRSELWLAIHSVIRTQWLGFACLSAPSRSLVHAVGD